MIQYNVSVSLLGAPTNTIDFCLIDCLDIQKLFVIISIISIAENIYDLKGGMRSTMCSAYLFLKWRLPIVFQVGMFIFIISLFEFDAI